MIYSLSQIIVSKNILHFETKGVPYNFAMIDTKECDEKTIVPTVLTNTRRHQRSF